MEVHLQNKTACEKQKLCHSLGRPSRSDFVQFEVSCVVVAYDLN